MDWVFNGYDFIEHWVKDDCNHNLATVTIYTDGKTPEETCEEILQAIGESRASVVDDEYTKQWIAGVNLRELEQRMSPVLLTVAISHFEGDYKTFQRHHAPIVAESAFQNAASALKPYGKPVDVEYMGHLIKSDRIKLIWKVTYTESEEELLWEFHIEHDGIGEKIVGMGIDI